MSWQRFAVGVGALALVGVLGACSRGSAHGEGTLQPAGDVRISGFPVTSAVHLKAGDIVSVGSGTATVTLPTGGQVEFRSGTLVKFAGGPLLLAGDLLANSPGQLMTVTTSMGDIAVHGVARLHRDLALSVGTYKGSATISAARTVVVPALAQDTIASATFAPEPTPLHLDANDTWDQRYLGTAIDLTEQLDGESRFVTANLPAGTAESVAFYTSSLHPLASRAVFTDGLLRSATGGSAPPIGDGLAAAAIALAGPGDFNTRWAQVFSLRSQGAQWGVISLKEGANPQTVLKLVDGAISLSSNTLPSPSTGHAAPASSPVAQLVLPPIPATHPSGSSPAVTVPAATHPIVLTGRSNPSAPQKPSAPVVTTPPSPATTDLLAPIIAPVSKLLHDLLGTKP